MLLRNDSELQDQDIYPTMSSPSPQHQHPEQTTYHPNHHSDSTTDDIWGDDDDSTTTTPQITSHPHQQSHISDIPRLKKEHTTAGYRDGVTQSKAASVQSGFDEGFGLGATIGGHTGRLLGVLTGLSSAVSSSSSTTKDDDTRLQSLLKSATEDLSVQSIFSPSYFESDGTWKYDVVAPDCPRPSSASLSRRAVARGEEGKEGGLQEECVEGENKDEGEGEGDKEEPALVFADIAAAHPLIKKWDEILQKEAERYDLVWDVLLPENEEAQDQRADAQQREDDDAGKLVDVGKDEGGKKPVVIQNKGALSW